MEKWGVGAGAVRTIIGNMGIMGNWRKLWI